MHRREFTYKYNDMRVPYSVWFTDDSRVIDTVIFLGSVQIGKLPEWVAEVCPPKTAVIQGAPHWYAKDDGSDIPDFMFGFTQSAFDQILVSYAINTVQIIADSQAVPGAIKLFTLDGYRKYFGGAVFVQPLGLTARIYRGTDEWRMNLFKKRIIWNGYHQLTSLLIDSRLRYNHWTIRKKADFNDPVAAAQYNSGLMYDSLPDLRSLLSVNDQIYIVCGAKDKIFPASEIRESLFEYNMTIPIHEVDGVAHSPFATKKGVKLLESAFVLLLS